MTRTRLAIGIVAASILVSVGLPVRAEDNDNPAVLAKALSEANVSLDQGLKASEREGKPISGKYEIENGVLQLSVYTMKGNQFSEVIVDHKTGSIEKAEAITDSDDLKDAKEQSEAMAKAKLALETAVAGAVKASGDYRAVSVKPMLDGGHPVAAIRLINGTEIKKVTEKLD